MLTYTTVNSIENGMVAAGERREDKQINGMLAECEKLSDKIHELNDEYADVKAILDTARYIDFDLRGLVYGAYEDKLDGVKSVYQDIRLNLLERGYDCE